MKDSLIHSEPVVRLAAFAGVFVLMAAWEVLSARRQLVGSKSERWLANLTLVGVNTLVLRLLFPSAALGMALVATERRWGLLNNLELPDPISIVAAVVALDLAIYLQHVLFHAAPTLWRLHMVHHADVDIDVTTGARFHPIEIVLSMGIKLAVIAALGPPVLAVLAFEVMLNATAMFNHSNVWMPGRLDRMLRWIVVTPDMHRVHHSVEAIECNSNFGFSLPWWDRLLGTYRAQPAAGHGAMTIGVAHLQDGRSQNLLRLLALPFAEQPGEYPLNSGTRGSA